MPGGLARRLDTFEDVIGVRKERVTTRRERHAAGVALEQRHADVLLELAHGLAQRRLRHLQSRGGPPEVQLFRDGDERLQPANLHGPLLGRLTTAAQPYIHFTQSANPIVSISHIA